jgi:hypothetical protein
MTINIPIFKKFMLVKLFVKNSYTNLRKSNKLFSHEYYDTE